MSRVLDLGRVPSQDFFPPATEPVGAEESTHALAMDLCTDCGLAQLADDDTITEEPRGLEPEALRDQAEQAVAVVADAGWLGGATVREFGSPHGGSWLPLLRTHGLVDSDVADVVVDCFGIMHEPEQRSAFALRAAKTATDGVLLIQFHPLTTIVDQQQWNALRHGHFAYYSLTALAGLLRRSGMSVVTSWHFDLYGGTLLVAAVHGDVDPDEPTQRLLNREAETGITDPGIVSVLQRVADDHVERLRAWLDDSALGGRRVYGYGAASRAVTFLSHAGIDSRRLLGVADLSPTKQGRRMPGTDVPIISPPELVDSDPDSVLLLLPDLHDEVCRRYPQLASRLTLGPQLIREL